MHVRRAVAALAGVLVLAGCGGSDRSAPPTPTPGPAVTTPGGAAPARRIAVTAREFAFEPNQFTVKAGASTFAVKNAGAIDHDFVIEDAKSKILAQANPFAAGKTVEVNATLAAGTYTVFCNIPGHREAGMTGTVKVAP